ncbi:phosphotransferase [Fictibacillus sp. BK138]|uniref:phosphotransferase n=1 Tax=Fictibacillus sp. BK138 TaxID=2512121 RepID=UPI00102A3C83|nr:phosphotransferase [Fictibacillus sp. BK138]RZT23935.1 homoserine kinase type II [Fictibacillus sp. BK138]
MGAVSLEKQAAERSLWEHLKNDAEHRFEWSIYKNTPIKRGWLNQKWKIETNKGTFLLKQYNRERIKKYDLDTIRTALRTQNRGFNHGVPCPELLEHGGELLHKTLNGELYTIMEFMEGNLIRAGNADSHQMKSLGSAIGKLHDLLNDGTLPPKKETMFNMPSFQNRIGYWDSVIAACDEKGLTELKPFILLQKEATSKLKKDFDNLTPGWCHRDLWVDNLLFSSDAVKAILDFDRMNYDFLELDIGRIIISACLHNHTLNPEAVHAFIEGYSHTNELSLDRVIQSLRLVWYMESTWWISVIEHEGDPPKRFAHEMIWLSQHLSNLEEILAWKK